MQIFSRVTQNVRKWFKQWRQKQLKNIKTLHKFLSQNCFPFSVLLNTFSSACDLYLCFIRISIVFCVFSSSFLVLFFFKKGAFSSALPSEALSSATLKPHWICAKADSIFWSSIYCSWAKPSSDPFLLTFNVASSFAFSSFRFCSKWSI